MTKIAYLTIDDSPSLHMPERIRVLAERGISALWFCRGDYLEERPEAAIQALRSGQILGNHSWDHAYFSKLTLEQATDQIDRTEAILEKLHQEAGVHRRLKVFRFPYEDRIGTPEHHAALQALLRERGFVLPALEGVRDPRFQSHVTENDASLFWTYDSEDWSLPAPDAPDAEPKLQAVFARMDRDEPSAGCGLHAPGTDVVVLHDHSHTGSLWPRVVQGLLERGLEFRPFV
jgi:peptidoglycan/xylan/chitin deacetylase (PgdA/CDA1 family)